MLLFLGLEVGSKELKVLPEVFGVPHRYGPHQAEVLISYFSFAILVSEQGKGLQLVNHVEVDSSDLQLFELGFALILEFLGVVDRVLAGSEEKGIVDENL